MLKVKVKGHEIWAIKWWRLKLLLLLGKSTDRHSSPNLHTVVPRSVCIQGMLKVKVKGHDWMLTDLGTTVCKFGDDPYICLGGEAIAHIS